MKTLEFIVPPQEKTVDNPQRRITLTADHNKTFIR